VDDDASNQGSLGGSNDGKEYGELSDPIEVTVSYAESVSYDATNDESTCNNTRELNNPPEYTLADLATDLESGSPAGPLHELATDSMIMAVSPPRWPALRFV
jgi:hypothetical protein